MFKRIRAAQEDPDVYVEVARLCTAADPAKALKMYMTSLATRQAAELPVPPELLNNIGCLLYLRKDYAAAREHFQDALKAAAVATAAAPEQQLAVQMTITYNFATVLEALNEKALAASVYRERILQRHPEYFEGPF